MIPKTPSKIPGATDFAMATRAVSKKVGILWFALARIGAEVTGNALGGKFKGGAGDPRGGMVLDVHGHFPTFAQNPLLHV